MGENYVLLHDWSDGRILGSAGADSIALLSITYSGVAGGQRTGTVYGVTRASDVQITVTTSGGSDVKSLAGLPASGLFSAAFTVPSSEYEHAVVGAKNTTSGTSAEDRVAITFGDPSHVSVKPGSLSGLDPNRLAYGAGNADRLHPSRTFVSLQPPVSLFDLGYGKDHFGVGKNDSVTVIDAKMFERSTKDPLAKLNKDRKDGTVSVGEYWDRLGALLSKQLRQATRKATARERAAAVSTRDAMRVARTGPDKRAKSAAKSRSSPAVGMALPGSSVLDVRGASVKDKLEEELERQLKARIAYAKHFRRLGVLLHDRLRFRPSNLVVGEPVAQVALTPGEQVEVRQTTESKSRTAFTDITDKEAEKNTSFSSTWSTDITSALSTQDNFTSSAQVGADASASVPDVPIEVGGSASSSMSEAHTIGANHSTTSRVSKTTTAAARMRSQHRVQIEITKEGSTSLAQTRTFRNFNNLRTMHHTLYKVYRREQITLERYDAQLCLKVVVDDPARTLRDAFLVGLANIDPYNEENYHVGPAPTELAGGVKSFTVTAPPDEFEDPFHGTEESRWVAWTPTGGSLRVLTGAPDGYRITSLDIVMTHMDLATFAPIARIDGTTPTGDVVERQLVPSGASFVRVGGTFRLFGGKVRWDNKPRKGSGGKDVVLSVNLPLRWSAPTSLFGELESALSGATFEIRSQWHPSNAVLADYMAKIEEARADMIAAFEPERVHDLHAIAQADYAGTVVDEAVGRQLTYPDNFDYSSLSQIFDLPNVVVDSLPYWASPVTREAYRDLLAKLQSLPAAFETNRILTDCLVASSAVVYLPVRPGMEERALELLPETVGVRRDVANDVEKYRRDHFALVGGRPALDMTVIDVPAVPVATPSSAAAWSSPWEQAPRKFDVLAQWSELVPTDGIHIETHLGDTVAADEREARRLERL
ncbi:MAG: hypothetical protein IT518_20320 [Burkholderiales bacterium]|nr:hypothetical protein [Burkholderiales bacterium]